MTAKRARLLHDALAVPDDDDAWRTYVDAAPAGGPTRLSDLLAVRTTGSDNAARRTGNVEPASAILARFGSGAMSFGALSATAQRDLFLAMRAVGGRSNSGEGGENPHYFVDGTHASTKQIASGRFGVTAEYLVAGEEIEIKMAQGAKPGEGGQLMGVKVSAEIARARHANPGVDLISPPPLHDIYSIGDLRQLIDELKVLSPAAQICVKLVAGKGVGTIAAGVVKAGADVIQISGGSGGTGAASFWGFRRCPRPIVTSCACCWSGILPPLRARPPRRCWRTGSGLRSGCGSRNRRRSSPQTHCARPLETNQKSPRLALL